MPTDIIKKVQIKNAQSGLNESYNVGAEGADVALSQTGNHIAESDVQAAMADIYDKFYNIDTTPTLNSDDLVTSGGVAQAIKDVQAVAVGTSSTAAATAAKVVTTIKGDFELENGADLIVRFTYENTASNITMAVDGTTAKPLYYKGAAMESTMLKADIPYEFVYDGTNYVLVGSAGGLSGFEMTEDEYDELPITDQRNPEKLFFIDDGLDSEFTATGIAYDNGDSGLEAVNVQDAIDELSVKGGGSGRYGTSSTASATAAKTAITTDENFTLFEGADVTVLFEHTDTAGSCTLSVDGTDAKPIYYNGSAIEAGVLTEDNAYEFVYDGTHYLMVGSAGGLKGFEKTTAEYNALPFSDKNDENKVFFISDSNDPDVPFSATTTAFDNTVSGLDSVNVQGAIDELEDGDGTPTFTSADVADGSATSWTNVNALASGESNKSILNKVSTMFKNIRYLYKMLGTTDISSIGNGTVTNAISTLNSNLGNKYPILYRNLEEPFLKTINIDLSNWKTVLIVSKVWRMTSISFAIVGSDYWDGTSGSGDWSSQLHREYWCYGTCSSTSISLTGIGFYYNDTWNDRMSHDSYGLMYVIGIDKK